MGKCRTCDEEPCVCITESQLPRGVFRKPWTVEDWDGEEMPPEVRAKLAHLLDQPIAKPMPSGQDPFEVKGLHMRCPRCKQPGEITVCWCQIELCRTCQQRHLAVCKDLQEVTRAYAGAKRLDNRPRVV